MRSVRCEICGVKALIAASTCPKCHHEFDVRDGAGALLPLAYCSSCESYYPQRLGSCRWCGTLPARGPARPYVWRAAGIAAFAVVAFASWYLRDAGPADVARRPAAEVTTADSVPARTDTSRSSTTVASAGAIDRESVTPPDTSTAPPTDSIVPVAAQPARAAGQQIARLAEAPEARGATTRSRTSRRWVNSVSQSWMVVRARPSEGARIVASIGPNSRVQLGESRGAWRRIRAKGLAGWVPR